VQRYKILGQNASFLAKKWVTCINLCLGLTKTTTFLGSSRDGSKFCFSGLEQTDVFACQGHKPDEGRCSCLGYMGLGTRSRKPYNLNSYKSLKGLMLLTGVFFQIPDTAFGR